MVTIQSFWKIFTESQSLLDAADTKADRGQFPGAQG